MSLKADDEEFLQGMADQLDETIRRLVLEEHALCHKIGEERVEELKEFWNQELPFEEEVEFKRTLDYWEKVLIQTWAYAKRAHLSRADVGKAFMTMNSKL
ncbi:MAG: hypothetical protein ABL903_08230 [Methylococcales bacterium]